MTTAEQIKTTDATITDEQADALAAFLAAEQDAWTAAVRDIVPTSDAERFVIAKIDTTSAYA